MNAGTGRPGILQPRGHCTGHRSDRRTSSHALAPRWSRRGVLAEQYGLFSRSLVRLRIVSSNSCPRRAARWRRRSRPSPTRRPATRPPTVHGAATLYREPGGAKRLRIGPKTEWGSPRVLGVVSQRGDWLGVQASELKNGEVAWIQRDKVTLDCVRWSLHADLSKRSVVRTAGRQDRAQDPRSRSAAPSNPTPKGRFASRTGCGHGHGFPLRLLRAGADRSPDPPAALLAGRRPAGDARDQRRGEHRPAVSLGCMRVRRPRRTG